MARPPHPLKIKLRWHTIAAPEDPAWDRWYEQGNPVGLVIPIAGPDDGRPRERAKEYAAIFARLDWHRRKYLDLPIARRAALLARQTHNDPTNLPSLGKRRHDHRDIAAILEREFDQEISVAKVARLINALDGVLGRWPTTDTHSITTAAPRRKSD